MGNRRSRPIRNSRYLGYTFEGSFSGEGENLQIMKRPI